MCVRDRILLEMRELEAEVKDKANEGASDVMVGDVSCHTKESTSIFKANDTRTSS